MRRDSDKTPRATTKQFSNYSGETKVKHNNTKHPSSICNSFEKYSYRVISIASLGSFSIESEIRTNNNFTSMSQRTPSISTITLSITALATTYFVTKYGLSGTIRYIWEGDHLPPEIRDEIDKLESIQSETRVQKKKMNRIGVVIETAKLNSVDEIVEGDDEQSEEIAHNSEGDGAMDKDNHKIQGGLDADADRDDENNREKRHYILSQVPTVSKDLGMLSYNLDKLATQVDSVQSHGDDDVKRQKKDLSHKLVEMMEICDGFMRDCGVESS
jgi:hypothetical protein